MCNHLKVIKVTLCQEKLIYRGMAVLNWINNLLQLNCLIASLLYL